MESLKWLSTAAKESIKWLLDNFKTEQTAAIEKKSSAIENSFALRKSLQEAQTAGEKSALLNTLRTRGVADPVALRRLQDKAGEKGKLELQKIEADRLASISSIQDEMKKLSTDYMAWMTDNEKNTLANLLQIWTNQANIQKEQWTQTANLMTKEREAISWLTQQQAANAQWQAETAQALAGQVWSQIIWSGLGIQQALAEKQIDKWVTPNVSSLVGTTLPTIKTPTGYSTWNHFTFLTSTQTIIFS